MVAEVLPLTREAGVKTLIDQASIRPEHHSHTYDDDIIVIWRVEQQIVQLRLDPEQTQGQWQSWNPSKYPDLDSSFQYLDITNPETWTPLLSELQC